MKFKSILLATAATLGFSAHAMAQQWTTKAPMPAAVAASGVAVINNIIYVVGGNGSTSNLNTVYAYDPSSDSWSTKAQMSFSRAELSVAAVNGKIYAIGGYNTNAVNIVEEYDPITNTWTSKAPMPTSRSVISCGVINNKIYVVGGWPGGLTSLEEYTPATNTWATKASLPFGIMSTNTCQVINNKLYYIGGKNSDANVTTTNQAYDPISDTWTAYTALPQQRWAGATSELDGEIYFFGGTNTHNLYSSNFTNNYIYNSFSNTWSNGLSMPRKRALQVAANVNGKIYLIGGVDSTGVNVNWNEEYSVGTITGLNPPSNQNTLKVFPNPANTHITIDYGNFASMNGCTLKVVNAVGQTVFATPINQQSSYIDLSTWTGSGIYYVQLIDTQNNSIENRKIVIQ
jgi:N-acetylneuraminic acid mutarotase